MNTYREKLYQLLDELERGKGVDRFHRRIERTTFKTYLKEFKDQLKGLDQVEDSDYDDSTTMVQEDDEDDPDPLDYE